MAEQLRLFDPADYLDMDGQWCIELDLDDEELELLQNSATIEGVDLNTYIIDAIKASIKSEESKNANVSAVREFQPDSEGSRPSTLG